MNKIKTTDSWVCISEKHEKPSVFPHGHEVRVEQTKGLWLCLCVRSTGELANRGSAYVIGTLSLHLSLLSAEDGIQGPPHSIQPPKLRRFL